MPIKLYNTLTRKKEIFRPRQGKKVYPVKSREAGIPSKTKLFNRVNLFVCGPTVYDFSHIGHARTYIVFDMVAKYLKQQGYNVFYLQNITDIDDKIINRAREEKMSWKELSKKFERSYLKDMKVLKIDSVKKYARATEYIKEIISQVNRLLKKGFAYQISDGIYYNISKFKNYGKLSKRTALQSEDAVSRIDEAREKKNKRDFCLWKISKPDEPKWSSVFGQGRPGWHIEDTAITEKYFGPQYDIHGGARDLIFPHHEAEIAQMEAISGKKPLVKYWLHTGFLTVKGQKMAKSLGNFITIDDFVKKHSPRPQTITKNDFVNLSTESALSSFGVGARLLRFFVIKSHYRSPIDYSEAEIEQIKKQLARLDEFISKLKNQKSNIKNTIQNSKLTKNLVSKTKKDFELAMADDFNTPKAIASVFDLVKKVNALITQDKLSPENAKEILFFLKKIDNVFGFIFWTKPKEKIPEIVLELIKKREYLRNKGLWNKADELRIKIKEMGYWIEDTDGGPKMKKM